MFTTEDKDLAKAVQKLRDAYAQELKQRKCTIFLKISDVHSKEDIPMSPLDRQIHDDKVEAKENALKLKADAKLNAKQAKAEAKQKAKQEKQAAKPEVVYCHATKMDGKKCTAKAKNGCNYCGRHAPKI